MILSRNFGRGIIERIFSLSILSGVVLLYLSSPAIVTAQSVPQYSKLLKEIHDELVQFEVNKSPDLIKQEFWMDLDGQEGNKEEHVVLMRYNDGLNLKMIVQITYFSEDKGKRLVRFAVDTKLVQCCIKEHELEITSSDYSEEEMENLFSRILIGIRNKKELLKLIKH